MLSKFYSSKIRIISFLAILTVVLGHCDGAARFINVKPLLCQWHVPWFFILSGYFLFISLNRDSVLVILVKKAKTLLIPYLMWCVIAAILNNPDGGVVAWYDYFGVTTPFPAGNRHLWYLHVLIVFQFTSVLLWMVACSVVRRSTFRMMFFLVLYCAFFSLSIVCGISTLYGTPTSPLFFLVGVLVSEYAQGGYVHVSREGKILLTVIFALVFIASRTVLFFGICPSLLVPVFRVVAIVAQIIFMWYGYDLLITSPVGIPWVMTPVFFIYCSHGLILAWLRSVMCPNVTSIGEMTGLFVACFSLSVLLAVAMRRVAPSLYSLITGGRI